MLGFDGVDPDFVNRWIDELPHIKKLMKDGSFRRLQTTTPPASCTAWTSFATGVNPGQHGIFDFIYRDPKTYLPDRSGAVSHKAEYLWGLFQTKPETFTTTMSGETFWKTADRAGLRSVVLRVPCLFPLETMERGVSKGGLGAPDLRGSEGTFHYYSSALSPRQASDPALGGKVVALSRGAEVATIIEGPANPLADTFERLTTGLHLKKSGRDALEINIDGYSEIVKSGHWSGWFRMDFKVTPFSSIAGMARFRVVEVEPEIKLYMSPVNYDPQDPAIAVTEPHGYSRELHDAVGDHKTVGWNHETWGLNEERIDEDAFMEDIFDTMRKTEEIMLNELDKRPAELFISVFVETDRTSHMMYRLIDKEHPRYDEELASRHGDAILQTYRRMDEIIGKVMGRLGDEDTLFILSDHGFHSWRRGFNVNTWLIKEGYMRLKNGADFTEKKFLLDVDWSRTRAYALGVGSIYLNLRGREGRGRVRPGAEARELAREIAAKLKLLTDTDTDSGRPVVAEVYLADQTWAGPRLSEAQDLQLGMASGYRISSATPLGGAPEGLFVDNMKKWSGDHATSKTSVTEGVFMSNRKVSNPSVSIMDLAPTILSLLGVEVPDGYDGKVLELSAPFGQGDN
ncbi:MAG: alkaline phosphatase family protein [Deltaproteobacteria bacterium]